MPTYSAKIEFRKDIISGKTGLAPFALRVSINSVRFRISIDEKVTIDQWNFEKGEVRKNHPQYNDINIVLRDAVARANEIFREYRLRNLPLTREIFLQEYTSPSTRSDFLDYMYEKIIRRGNHGKIVKATKVQHLTVHRKLKAFKKTIMFAELSPSLIDDFDYWHLQQLRKEVGEKLVNDGNGPRSNAIKIIKTYMNLATQDGIKFENFSRSLDARQYSPEAIFLSEKELRKLINQFLDPNISETRRIVLRCFLFCCFTGLAFQDMVNLTWESNIREDQIKYVRQKLMKQRLTVTVPLVPAARFLIGTIKYTGPVFQPFSEQEHNRELKKIAEDISIKKKLTTHVARHTFATLYLERGGEVTTLQKLLGHTKIETTMKYVHVTEEQKKRLIFKAFGKFVDTSKWSEIGQFENISN